MRRAAEEAAAEAAALEAAAAENAPAAPEEAGPQTAAEEGMTEGTAAVTVEETPEPASQGVAKASGQGGESDGER